jgi:hypothetical protein
MASGIRTLTYIPVNAILVRARDRCATRHFNKLCNHGMQLSNKPNFVVHNCIGSTGAGWLRLRIYLLLRDYPVPSVALILSVVASALGKGRLKNTTDLANPNRSVKNADAHPPCPLFHSARTNPPPLPPLTIRFHFPVVCYIKK